MNIRDSAKEVGSMSPLIADSEHKGELRYAWLVVLLLMGAHILSFVDRQILNLMVEPIRHDLGIGDTEMSLLMGFSFAIFYTVCGIPLAWCADRYSRKWLIAGGACAWSIATAGCGLAATYSQMLLARIGVGVGEASLTPASYSLITDYFPRNQRATAISVFSTGTYVGSGLALLIGGFVIHWAMGHGSITLPLFGSIHPWQVVFLVLGGAGLLFSLVLLLVRDPQRSSGHRHQPFSASVDYLRGNLRTLLCHHFGFSLISLAGYGSAAWIPSYFIRVHSWSPTQVGLVYGSAVAIFGTFGVILGGHIADRLTRRGVVDGTLRVGIFAALAAVPTVPLLLMLHSTTAVFAALAVAVLFFSMPLGCAAAALQEIVPSNMRAQASAVYLFVLNMVGLGLGPTAVALCTDLLFGDDMAVGQSLALVCSSALLSAALLLYVGLAPYRRSHANCHGTTVNR